MEHLQYPIGRFIYSENPNTEEIQAWKADLKDFAAKVEALVTQMPLSKLDTPYRPGGWTGRQVVHHVADSHCHALMRFKWSLTEDQPTIKPYMEDRYAQLADYSEPIESALLVLRGIHIKWACLVNHLTEEDEKKGYFHPETGKFFTLQKAMALYSWHSRHHLGHLQICASS